MEEKKLYDFMGTVIISTEEYRELIDERATFKCEADNYRGDYYKAISEAKAKDIEIEKLKEELNRLDRLTDSLLDVINGEEPDA